MTKTKQQGFTLVEVLLVVVIIAILAGVVIVAINPARQISQANNTQRNSDVKTLLDGIHQYAIDKRGALPAALAIPEGSTELAAIEIGSTATTEVDICADIVPVYIAKLPIDPTDADATFTTCTAAYHTGYTVAVDADGRVTVAAPSAELSETISVTR